MTSKEFYRQLLQTSLGPPPDSSLAIEGSPSLATTLQLIQHGDYLQALSTALKELNLINTYLNTEKSPPESSMDWFQLLTAAVASQQFVNRDNNDTEQQKFLVAAAVASLYIFTQMNLVGPYSPQEDDGTARIPQCPFDLLCMGGADTTVSSTPAAISDMFGRDSMTQADRWACSELTQNGEDLIGRIHFPQYLLLSRRIFMPISQQQQEIPLEDHPFIHWWAMRTLLMQQRILSARSAALRDELVFITKNVVDAICCTPDVDSEMAAAALLEAAMMETAYGYVQQSKMYTEQAMAHAGLDAQLGGALGVRTVHQQDPRAQLILNVKNANKDVSSQGSVPGDVLDAFLMEGSGSNTEVRGLEDVSDVLRQPKLINDDTTDKDDTDTPSVDSVLDLSPLQQAAILALALHTKKGSSADDLQPWEVLAHVLSVLQQPRSEFLIRAVAHLQVTRVERQRSRTRERALLDLEGLTNALDNSTDTFLPSARMYYAFAVWFPLRISLRKELGEAFVALGLIGAALPLFESLELWDNIIICYRLLDKRVAAEQLIQRRLEVTPNEPRLWCAMGDLTLDDTHYLEAWNRSSHRNARAARSLARNAIRNERFEDAAMYWEHALALNPLHPEGWFNLGWCYIKTKQYETSLKALTRSAQMDPENGEAWNNLAAVHIQLEHWRESYAALTEAVKHNRNSWHVWDNYASVAVKVGEWQVATRALGQVVGLSKGERLDISVLASVIDHLEQVVMQSSLLHPGHEVDDNNQEKNKDVNNRDSSNALLEFDDTYEDYYEDSDASVVALAHNLSILTGETASSSSTVVEHDKVKSAMAIEAEEAKRRSDENFIKLVGNLMKQIASTVAGDSSFWAEYARYFTAVGEHSTAIECLLKRVRALQGTAWRASQSDFSVYSSACIALCRAYINSGGSKKELSQARMLMRGAVKQAGERYEETVQYGDMVALLSDIEERIQKISTAELIN